MSGRGREDQKGFAVNQFLYERARPDYPHTLLPVLEVFGIRLGGARVLDVATGTGKLLRLLREGGGIVTGLDLSLAMLVTARRKAEEARLVGGDAEALPLRAGTFSIVSCGQGFHWLAPTKALREFRRALKAGGYVLLAWNRRLRSSKLEQRIELSVEDLRRDAPSLDAAEWRERLESSPDFERPVTHEFCWIRKIPASLLVDLVLSRSYLARQEEQTRFAIRTMLSKIIQEEAEGESGHLRLAYSCGIILSRAL